MKSTEWHLAGSAYNVGTGTQWSNPQNLTVDSEDAATVSMGLAGSSSYLTINNFGFALPMNAKIHGLSAELITKANTTSNFLSIFSVSLDNEDGRIGSTSSGVSGPGEAPEGWQIVEYGGVNSKWGLALTPILVNHPKFGISIRLVSWLSKITISIRTVKLNVYYSLPDILHNTNGVLREGFISVKDNGIWKPGLTSVKDGEIWKT